MTKNPTTLTTESFRFRQQAGGEVDAEWLEVEGAGVVALTRGNDFIFRLRWLLANRLTGLINNMNGLTQISVNGGTFFPVTSGSSVMQSIDPGALFIDDAITTQQLSNPPTPRFLFLWW